MEVLHGALLGSPQEAGLALPRSLESPPLPAFPGGAPPPGHSREPRAPAGRPGLLGAGRPARGALRRPPRLYLSRAAPSPGRAGTWRAPLTRQRGGAAARGGAAEPRSVCPSCSRTFSREVPYFGGRRRGAGRGAEFLEGAAVAAGQHGLLHCFVCSGRGEHPSSCAGERRAAPLPVASCPAGARGESGRAGRAGGGSREPWMAGRCLEPCLSWGAGRRREGERRGT